MGNITHITSGQSNLTKKCCIAAAHARFSGTVFARLHQCAPHLIDTSFGPSESTTQTASRSLQPFLDHIARTMYVAMLSIVTDRVAWSVTLVSPAKTAEPIEMPFGLWTWMGLTNHVSDGGSHPAMWRGNFEGGNWHPIVKYRDTVRSSVQKWLNWLRYSVVICAKTADPIVNK